jgi:L-seryl-tRNA(Ser) seleniumtransferase
VADFRIIPSIEQLRQRPAVTVLVRRHGHAAAVAALRNAAAGVRSALAAGTAYDDADAVAADITQRAGQMLARAMRVSLRPVLNATGVIVHTNLGRAPLSAGALQQVTTVAAGYSTLEYDLEHGRRGSRSVHAASLLTTLIGAEAAAVVNNNAAATLLILTALGARREVIVSRGELVEIGGGFRVPDVMAQSGAVLREVGTTNRTRLADYRAAIGPHTAMLLRVHRSNFRIEGFTERPSLDGLVALARESSIPLVEDLGSGCLDSTFSWEPTVQQSVAAGVDLVCFSGDKMLGGPQSGIIVGRTALVDQVQRHPLMRALRVDKLTLAALEGTLLDYRAGLQMMSTTAGEIETRARTLADQLQTTAWRTILLSGASAIGGGSAPGVELPTVLLGLERDRLSADALEQRLRRGDPPVIARIGDDRVVLDLRTVAPADDDRLLDALLSLSD